ncbi:MAG: 50S ribosomal protein L10 [bacterium]|nr:50S ribosomal protein L10 [bacterium]
MHNTRPVNTSKAARVEALKKILAESKSVAVVDYTGLKVGQATQLRKNVRAAGGEVKVEKNTLFKLAVGKPEMDLEGLSAFVFSKTDEVAALQALAEFMKKAGVGTFKAGLLGDRILTATEVEALAKTPNREVLIAQLLSALNSPLYSLAYSLNWNLSKLVRVLDAISKKGVN